MGGPTNVPFNDLERFARTTADELVAAVERVIRSGWFLLGPETDAFEQAFASTCGAAHAIGVGNGTDALELALRGVGCGPGDEVVVTANAGMYATTACLAIGAAPVFADVDDESLLIDPASVEELVGDRTRAVVATHLYGSVVDIDALRSRLPEGVAIVEDCAQAHGAQLGGRPVGSLGDIAAFSFYPTKNLGAAGDAGAVVTHEADAATRVRSLRQYGWESRYVSTVPGGRNSRIDEIQAAVLAALLPHLPARNERRRAIRARYAEALGDRLRFVGLGADEGGAVAHLCVTRSSERDRLLGDLADAGIGAAVHYPLPDHRQPILDSVPFRQGDLTTTERACDEVLSLPCFPELRDDEVEAVIDAVTKIT